jgi:hypothetical protein
MRRQSFVRGFLLVLVAALAGCSMSAPKYTPAVGNVQRLRDAGEARVKVGSVTAQGKEAHDESIGLRGSPMRSPYGSYSNYLREALTQELREAQLLDGNAQIEIGAELLKNDVDATGFTKASADIQARFKVIRAGATAYDRVKSARIEWDSNFIGAVAIPRALERYPELVTALLNQLYADEDFLTALKP